MGFIPQTDSERPSDHMDALEERADKLFSSVVEQPAMEFGALSHPGRVRPNNEDHYAVVRRSRSRRVLLTNLPANFPRESDEHAYALAVADGIGGAAFGELASTVALRDGWDLTSRAFKWHFQMSESEYHELEETIRVYAQLIHRRLLERSEADPELAGMGTTITAALLLGYEAVVAHVGDSRAYAFRDGVLQRLTHDHTLAQKMIDAGVIPSIEHASRLMKNMLVNCIGGRERGTIEVDTIRVPFSDGDQLLLCSDGLSDMVPDAEIAQVLAEDRSAQQSCQTLVDLALNAGGKDNITVVLAKFSSSADAEQETKADRIQKRRV